MKRTASRPPTVRQAVVLLFVACLLLYNLNRQYKGTGDTAPNVFLPISVLLHGDFYLERFPTLPGTQQGPPYVFYLYPAGGRLLSPYPPAPALVALPVYLAPALWIRAAQIPYNSDTFHKTCVISAKLAASAMAAATVVLVFLSLAPPLGVDRALPLALLFAFGTSVFPVASQGLWTHDPAMLALAGAAYLWLYHPRRLVWLGLLLGVAVASRPPAIVPAIIFAAFVAWREPRRLLHFLWAPALIGAGVLAYNLHFFGLALGGYEHLNRGFIESQKASSMWSTNPMIGLPGLLISPSRGLLIFSPFLVAAFAGLGRALTSPQWADWRPLALSVAAYMLMLSFYSCWWGGMCYGPRLLLDVIPFLMLLVVPVWRDIEAVQWRRVAFQVLAWTGVFVQSLGGMMWDGGWYTQPTDVDYDQGRLWDWKDSEITRLLRRYRWSTASSGAPALVSPPPRGAALLRLEGRRGVDCRANDRGDLLAPSLLMPRRPGGAVPDWLGRSAA